MTNKDKAIFAKAKKENIPVLIIDATNPLAFKILCAYTESCQQAYVGKKHMEFLENKKTSFIVWKQNNPDLIKLPK